MFGLNLGFLREKVPKTAGKHSWFGSNTSFSRKKIPKCRVTAGNLG